MEEVESHRSKDRRRRNEVDEVKRGAAGFRVKVKHIESNYQLLTTMICR